jgi:hypothetical protein
MNIDSSSSHPQRASREITVIANPASGRTRWIPGLRRWRIARWRHRHRLVGNIRKWFGRRRSVAGSCDQVGVHDFLSNVLSGIGLLLPGRGETDTSGEMSDRGFTAIKALTRAIDKIAT